MKTHHPSSFEIEIIIIESCRPWNGATIYFVCRDTFILCIRRDDDDGDCNKVGHIQSDSSPHSHQRTPHITCYYHRTPY